MRSRCLYFLNHCKKPKHIFQIHAQLLTSGLFQDLSFSGRLLKLASDKNNGFSYALSVFKCIHWPDAFCVNTVIKVCSRNNCNKRAVIFYVEMLRESWFYPNCFTFPPLISACAKLGCLSLGQMCHGHAVRFGVDSILPVQNSLIFLYASCGIMVAARYMFDEMLDKDSVSWNTIVCGYAKAGEMGLAHNVFDAMPEKSVVSWNIMMTEYLNFGNPGISLKLFREMIHQGFICNDTAAVCVVTACGRSARLREGRSVHGFLVKFFPCMSLFIDTALIDMYSKCEKANIAHLIFHRMHRKNTVSWNAIILGHSVHGDPVVGLSLYSKMVNTSGTTLESAGSFDKDGDLDETNPILPDEVTFVGVLCACSRLRKLNEGRAYFSQMIDEFQVKPNFVHYWCMANLMANVGLMQEAIELLKNFHAEDDSSSEHPILEELFRSSRFLGDVSTGEKIVKSLIEQDPMNFSPYNLLVNIYAAAGKWEDAMKTKDMMKKKGITKPPRCYLKDLKEIVSDTKLESDVQKVLMGRVES